MSSRTHVSSSVRTQFLEVKSGERYAYRRFGSGPGLPLLLLQHFTGTLDNWDPALTDALAGRARADSVRQRRHRAVVGLSADDRCRHGEACRRFPRWSRRGDVRRARILAWRNGRPANGARRSDDLSALILVGTAPRGGEDIMHLEKPRLAKHLQDPSNKGYGVLQKIFFTLTPSGQAAGASFVERLAERKEDLDGVSGPAVANAQMAAFRDWERVTGERFAELRTIRHPTLVVNGVHDEMIPIVNSYRLVENLPNAVLLAYPDAGHGSLFQYHDSFARQAATFLSVSSESAAY